MTRVFPLLFALIGLLRADPLEDAARSLAKKIASHISTSDTVRFTERNVSSLPAASAFRARQTIERSIRRNPRNGTPLEVQLTLSENPDTYVLVAEITKGEERWVEVGEYLRGNLEFVLRATPERRVIWEQETPILDVTETDGAMLVLDVNELAVYEHRTKIRAFPLLSLSRDPAGRVVVDGDTVSAQTPDRECRGTWRPELKLDCATTGEPGNVWRAPDLPPHYAMVRIGKTTLLAELDGRIHAYSSGKQIGSWTGWGGELATICGNRVLASSDRDRRRGDALRLFFVGEGTATFSPASNELEMPGPVVALHSRATGAVAIVRYLNTPNYAAYHITVDCTR